MVDALIGWRSFLAGLITALAAPVVVKTQRILGLRREIGWTGEMSSVIVNSEAVGAKRVTLPPPQVGTVYTIQNKGDGALGVFQDGDVIRFIKNPRTYKFEVAEDGKWIAKEVT